MVGSFDDKTHNLAEDLFAIFSGTNIHIIIGQTVRELFTVSLKPLMVKRSNWYAEQDIKLKLVKESTIKFLPNKKIVALLPMPTKPDTCIVIYSEGQVQQFSHKSKQEYAEQHEIQLELPNTRKREILNSFVTTLRVCQHDRVQVLVV